MSKKRFTEEFKIEAVKQVIERHHCDSPLNDRTQSVRYINAQEYDCDFD